MPMFEVTVIPIGSGSPSISRFVKTALEEIKASGLEHRVTPMGTCIIGTYAQVFPVLQSIHSKLQSMGVRRIATTIKVDDRFDKELTFDGKIRAVCG